MDGMLLYPRFPAFISGQGISAGRIITVASALRLGHLVRLRCADRLHRLLCSASSQWKVTYYVVEVYFNSLSVSAEFHKYSGSWRGKQRAFKHYLFLKALSDALSSSCSSCLSFFSGNESGKRYVGTNEFQVKTSAGRLLDRRGYIAQIATQGKLLLWGAKVNSLIDKGQLWRLVTSSFLHANIGHLMVNCYSLNSIGPTVEKLSGSKRFLAVYFTSAVASSLMSYHFCQLPAVGASGAIFGLVGSFSVFILRHRNIFGGGKEELQQILHVIALNMVIGLLSRGIDNWGHVSDAATLIFLVNYPRVLELGGLLGGAAVSWLIGPAWRRESRLGDGRFIYTDKAPICRLIGRRMF
ncbi:hypothetical protein AXF42_Ash017534 [Apostasia shenzhenica]|uniref:Peptidase S54 rhomboid domain-containing protein n=1 Tax=Apostasia shenzhenica TaxID=1088818 RepID=A0A2I0A378_9ASPA|nr:hypothetical protein AXF42_Ash017534 [Apostasia shenzhenica]